MRARTCHIALALIVVTFLAGGCTGKHVSVTEGGEINFGVGGIRMEQQTKLGGTLHINFEDGDGVASNQSKIAVSAWHDYDGQKVFDNQVVVLEDDSQNLWSYTPKKKWRWANGADSYDFLAVANPVEVTDIVTPDPSLYIPSAEFPLNIHAESRDATADSPFTLTVSYDATYAQYDLMMAGYRRSISESDPSAIVPLVFQHALCAVKVRFIKEAGGANFRVTSFHFSDLMTRADIKASLSPTLQFSLSNAEYSNEPEFGLTTDYASATLVDDTNVPYEPYDDADTWELLLPQTLKSNTHGHPTLNVTFKTAIDTEYSRDIILDEIMDTDDVVIDEWVAGQKYVYEIHILMDGGVKVNVITIPWDVIDAETPGLLI